MLHYRIIYKVVFICLSLSICSCEDEVRKTPVAKSLSSPDAGHDRAVVTDALGKITNSSFGNLLENGRVDTSHTSNASNVMENTEEKYLTSGNTAPTVNSTVDPNLNQLNEVGQPLTTSTIAAISIDNSTNKSMNSYRNISLAISSEENSPMLKKSSSANPSPLSINSLPKSPVNTSTGNLLYNSEDISIEPTEFHVSSVPKSYGLSSGSQEIKTYINGELAKGVESKMSRDLTVEELGDIKLKEKEFLAKLHGKIAEAMENQGSTGKLQQPAPPISLIKQLDFPEGTSFLSSGVSKSGPVFLFVDSKGNTHLQLFSNLNWVAESTLRRHGFCTISQFLLACTVENNEGTVVKVYEILDSNLRLESIYEVQNASLLSSDFGRDSKDLFTIMDHSDEMRYIIAFGENKALLKTQISSDADVMHTITSTEYSVELKANADDKPSRSVSLYSKKMGLEKHYHYITKFPVGHDYKVSSALVGKDIILCLTSYCIPNNDSCDPRSTANIYKYNGTLTPIQLLKTEGGLKSKFVEVDNITYIVILNALTGLKVYQYSNGTLTPTRSFQGLVNHGITDFTNQDGIIAIAYNARNDGKTVQFYKIEKDVFKRQISTKPIQIASIYKSKLQMKIKEIKAIAKLLFTETKKQRAFYDSNLRKLSQVSTVTGGQMLDPNTENIIAANISTIETMIPKINKRIRDIMSQLSQGIDIKQNTVWPENLSFSSLIIGSTTADNLVATAVDDRVVPILEDLIPLQGYQSDKIMRPKIFRNVAIKKPFVKFFGRSKLFTFVTLNRNHTLDKKISFKGITTRKIISHGLIDDMNISTTSVLLRSGKQQFNGSLTCNRASTEYLDTNMINQYPLNQQDSKDVSGTTIINGNVHIKGDLIVNGNFYTERIFNHKLDDVKNNLLKRTSGDIQIIEGKYHIDKAHINSLMVKNINGHPLVDSIYMNLETMYYKIPRAVLGNVKAENIIILNSIDNIKVVNGSLDIMMLNAPQTVLGAKQFQQIHLSHRTPPKYSRLPQGLFELERRLLHEHKERSRGLYAMEARLFQLEEIFHQLRSADLFLEYLMESKPKNVNVMEYTADAKKKTNRILGHMSAYLNEIARFLSMIKQQRDVNVGQILPPTFLSDNRNVMDLLSHVLLPPEASNYVANIFSKIADIIPKVKRNLTWINLSMASLQQRIKRFRTPVNSERYLSKFSGSTVIGTVSGHYLKSLPMFKPVAGDTIKAGNLKLTGNFRFMKVKAKIINGVHVEKLLSRAVPVNLTPPGNKVVFYQDVLVKGNVDIDQLNGQHTSDFAVANELNIFQKPMNFKTIVSKGNVEVKGDINSHKLRESVNYMVTDKKDCNMPQSVTFKNLKVERLSCGVAFIGENNVDHIVLGNETTYISGKKRFSRLKITGHSTKIEGLTVNEINGVKLNSLGRQEVSGPLILRDTLDLRELRVKGDARLLGNIYSELGSKNFEKTLVNSFTRNDVILDGNLVLTGSTDINNLNFSTTLQGLPAELYNGGLLLNGKKQVLTGRNTFADIKVKNLIVRDGKINGLNINKLAADAVKVDEDAVFQTDTIFEEIRSQGHMTVTGLVQGINLTSDAIWDEEDVLFTANKFFTNPVNLTDNFSVKGTINGMDVDRICRAIVGVLTIEGSAFFKSGIQAEVLSSDGSIVPINEDESHWMINRPTIIKSPTVFSSLHTNNIFVTDEINGVSARRLLQQHIPSDCNKIAQGNYVIKEVNCNQLDTKTIKTTLINRRTTDILGHVLLQGQSQYFDKHVALNNLQADYVTVDGLLNGVKVDEFCLKDQDCYVAAKKEFTGGITIGTSQVNADSLINGIGVGRLNLMQKGPHIEEIYIEDSLIAPSIKISGTLNGVKFDVENIMTKNSDQNIRGNFKVSVKGQLAVLAKDIQIPNGLFAGLNFSKVLQDKRSHPVKFEMTPGGEAQILVKYAKYIKENATAVRSTLLRQSKTFKGWKIINRLPSDVTKASSIGSIFHKKFGSHSIAVHKSNEVEIWEYSRFNEAYKHSGMSVNINCSNDARALHTSKDLYIIISSTCSSPLSRKVERVYSQSNLDQEGFSAIWKIYSNQPQIFKEVPISNPVQILVFEIDGKQCFLTLSEGAATQPIYCNAIETLYLQQNVKTDNAFMALYDSFVTKSNIKDQLLLIANKGLRSISPYIDIWIYVSNRRTFALQKTIKITRLIWFDTIAVEGGLYLVTVSAQFCGSNFGEIIVYRISRDESSTLRIEVDEVLEIRNPLQAAFLRFPLDTLGLVVLDVDGFASTYEKKGIAKFSPQGKFRVGRNAKMQHWNSDERAFLSITPISDQVAVQCEDTYTRIYEAKFRGMSK